MKNSKKTLTQAIFAALTISLILLPASTLAAFKDVPTTHPYYDAIKFLEEQGFIKGYPDKTFKPDQLITRAELIKLTFNHIGYKAPEKVVNSTLIDVAGGSWYAPYAMLGLEMGAFSVNFNDKKFYPDAPISRIEALKMIMKIEGIPTPYSTTTDQLPYPDVKPTTNYRYLVTAALNAGILQPKSSKQKFYAFQSITRGEATVFLAMAETYRATAGSDYQIFLPTGYSASEVELLNNSKFPILLDVWQQINASYLDKKSIDQDDLVFGAIKGMADKLNDPYTVFESPTTASDLEDTLNGKFQGIGIIIEEKDGGIYINAVLPDSPAEKAGLKAGDYLTKIDDTILAGKDISEVVKLIKGAAGTKVQVTTTRSGATNTVTITREEIKYNSVQTDSGDVVIPNNIAYLSINQFTDTTGTEFSTALAPILKKSPKALILDLRNNPGGYLASSYEVLEHFLKKDDIMVTIKIDTVTDSAKSTKSGELSDKKIPVYVLVNENSASAAEVVAGALRDNGIATVIGTLTYGKGSVQEITNYTDGSLLKLSVAEWLTPSGQAINKVGLTPDIIVPLTDDDLAKGNDSQLKRAVAEAQKN